MPHTIAREHYIGRREEICRDVGRETVRRTQEKEKYKEEPRKIASLKEITRNEVLHRYTERS